MLAPEPTGSAKEEDPTCAENNEKARNFQNTFGSFSREDACSVPLP